MNAPFSLAYDFCERCGRFDEVSYDSDIKRLLCKKCLNELKRPKGTHELNNNEPYGGHGLDLEGGYIA